MVLIEVNHTAYLLEVQEVIDQPTHDDISATEMGTNKNTNATTNLKSFITRRSKHATETPFTALLGERSYSIIGRTSLAKPGSNS